MHRSPTVRSGRLVRLVAVTLLASTVMVVGGAGPVAAVDHPPSFITTWGTSGTGNGQFRIPIGVAVDSTTGDVYVVEADTRRVQKFTSTGTFLTKWGTEGSGNGQFQAPYGVAVDPNTGDVYVTDNETDRVQKFDSDGTFLTAWGSTGTGDGQFRSPFGVAVARPPAMSTSPTSSTTGSRSSTRTAPTSTNGVRTAPATASSGGRTGWQSTPLPATSMSPTPENDRVQKFTSTGTFLTKWGTRGASNGRFAWPGGVAVDPTTGDVYVADIGNDRVQKFDSDGTFLTKWGTYGSGNGQFSIPVDVAVDGDGDVYVADLFNFRVQKFGYRGRPDGRIRRGAGVLVGNDIYNTTGTGQTSSGVAARGHRVTYYASIQNDARFAEQLRLRGQASTPNFTVRYYNPTEANITPQVTAGSFRTPVLAPEATYRVQVVVTVLRSAHPNASVARTLTATSTTYPTVKDTVRFITSRA